MANILLVDDDPLVRETTRAMIDDSCHHIIEAENGLEALALFKKNPQSLNLIITDLMMPQMNGIELAKNIKTIDQDIKILAISGGGMLSQREEPMIEAKKIVDLTLKKPFTLKELENAIHSLTTTGT